MEKLTNQMCEVLDIIWSVLDYIYTSPSHQVFILTPHPFHVAMASSTWVPQCLVTNRSAASIINSKVWLGDGQVKKPHTGEVSKVHWVVCFVWKPTKSLFVFFFCSTTDIHDSPYFSAWLQAVIATVAQFLPWIEVCIAVLYQNSLCFSE